MRAKKNSRQKGFTSLGKMAPLSSKNFTTWSKTKHGVHKRTMLQKCCKKDQETSGWFLAAAHCRADWLICLSPIDTRFSVLRNNSVPPRILANCKMSWQASNRPDNRIVSKEAMKKGNSSPRKQAQPTVVWSSYQRRITNGVERIEVDSLTREQFCKNSLEDWIMSFSTTEHV